MVSVRRSVKCRLSHFLPEAVRREHFVRKLIDALSRLLCNITSDCVRAAQHLKRIEPEAIGFILHIEPFQAEVGRHFLKALQRGHFVLGK